MVKKIKYAQDYEDDPIGSFADFVHNTYRSNIESFKQFCDGFLRAVNKCADYDSRRHTDLISVFTTASDEAFILVAIENSFNTWKSMALLKVYKQQHGDPSQEQIDEYMNKLNHGITGHPTPQWTTKSSRKFTGWKPEGIRQFNHYLIELVPQQRGTSKHLEKQFLAYAKANLLDETNSADNNNKSEDSVLAANELGSFDWSGAHNYASKTKQAAKTNKQTYSSSSSTSSSSEEEEL